MTEALMALDQIHLEARLDKKGLELVDSLLKLVESRLQLCLALVGMKEAFPGRPGSPCEVAAEAPRSRLVDSGMLG